LIYQGVDKFEFLGQFSYIVIYLSLVRLTHAADV